MGLFGRTNTTAQAGPAGAAEVTDAPGGGSPPPVGNSATATNSGSMWSMPTDGLTPELRSISYQASQEIMAESAEERVALLEGRASLEQKLVATLGRLSRRVEPEEWDAFISSVRAELFGLGPIEPLLADDTITEVMVNGPHQVWIERSGHLIETNVRFVDDDHVMAVIKRILEPLGRRIDRTWPMVDARLSDGSRVNAIIPPCAVHGPSLTIRKFFKSPLTVEQLVQFGSITSESVDFLKACVTSRLNVVVAGGTGSGKTTLLNVLSSFIPDKERVVTIEDAAEVQLRQRHVVTLESAPARPDGSGRVGIRDLVVNSLRMRPDRIIVGEVRSGEALDMLQAMNTGHDGSLTTAHANSPRDTLSRIETMVLMAGIDLSLRAIREQISSAFDLIVFVARMRDRSRKVTHIVEVQGMEGDVVVLSDIFKFRETNPDGQGPVQGRLEPTGIRPRFTPKLEAAGFFLPSEMFGVNRPGQQQGWR